MPTSKTTICSYINFLQTMMHCALLYWAFIGSMNVLAESTYLVLMRHILVAFGQVNADVEESMKYH